MGHDEHFLRRLDRVSDHHVELSLTLYRDEELLREVLSRADLPPGAERLAISLNDPHEGPFVIVTRAGRFVTCLGEGMRVGSDLVVLTRPRLDAAIAKVERMRERIARVVMLERDGHDGTAQRLLRKLADSGLRFCREDSETLIQVWPLIGKGAGATFAKLVEGINAFESEIGALRWNKLRPAELEIARKFGRIAWAASNLLVLTSEPEAAEIFDQVLERYDADARLAIWETLFRLGTFSHSLRVLWSIGQRRKRALEHLRSLRETRDVELTVMREFGLGVVALGSSKARAEAFKELARLPPDAASATPLQNLAAHCGGMMRKVIEDDAQCDRVYLQKGRSVAAALLNNDGNPTEEMIAAISEDTARAIVPNLAVSWLGSDPHLEVIPYAIPWLARATRAELFLPRAFAEQIRPNNDQDVIEMMKAFAKTYRLAPAPTVQNEAPKVGRNDSCTCGSGKKFKRCCAR